MSRVLLFGAAWVAFLAALAVAVGVPARRDSSASNRPKAAIAARKNAASLRPPALPPRAGTRYPGWTVTRAYSAHQMMVVEVETDGVTDASSIAAQVVEPLKDRYDEVLIYVRGPDQRTGDRPTRRIQWTPRAGYIETIYNSESRTRNVEPGTRN